jgi:hypothetical protein
VNLNTDWDGPVGVAFDAVTACRAILHDPRPGALAKIREVLESTESLGAMHAAGFCPERNDRHAILRPHPVDAELPATAFEPGHNVVDHSH